MSFAIIRNEKYTRNELKGIYRHNERKNIHYSNKEIDKSKIKQNYHLKEPKYSYELEFDRIRQKCDLKGQIHHNSIVACEYLITSNNEFFKNIGKEETERFFKCCYEFVCEYKNLGSKYIISAVVHLDETTPHLHITYIPVIHTLDKNKKSIDKVLSSQFWKGKDSYKQLQDNFYNYITEKGFDLERGKSNNVEHISTDKLKQITEYDNIKYELNKCELKEKNTNDISILREENKKLIKYCNTLRGYYVKSMKAIDKVTELQEENRELEEENEKLKNENIKLHKYINTIFEYVSILFNFSKDRLKKLIEDFIKTKQL